eukprot:sb/3463646/
MAVQTMPMKFGRHYLELNGLNDLQLICRGGEIVRTSSFPLAINSFVICDLVGKQQMKELDVEEFSHSSVASFVDCCYTGTAVLTRENFREVNKLSAVFKVEWMVGECLKFYTDLCSGLTSGSLELALFLFDEAAYILKERNNRDLQDALSTGLKVVPPLRLALVKDFISHDPNQQEFVNTDLCLSMASSSEGSVLYEWLIENFKGKPHPLKITDIEKRFLRSAPLTLCFHSDQTVYERLLETVELCLSKEDLMSLFKIFARVPVSLCTASPQNSPSSNITNLQNSIVYPIQIPALGECTSFLDAVKVIDNDPRIKSFIQFVSSLDYCCDVFGDTTSQELVDAITVALDKRKSWASLLGECELQFFNFPDVNPKIKSVLSQYIKTKQDLYCQMSYERFSLAQLSLPFHHSEIQFLDLYHQQYCDGNSYCDENPLESDKRCKVAIEVSVAVKDYKSWPVIAIRLVEDRAILEAQTDAHFHQDPDFLQHIFVDCFHDDNSTHFTLCSDLNKSTGSLGRFYMFWKRNDTITFCTNWPKAELPEREMDLS